MQHCVCSNRSPPRLRHLALGLFWSPCFPLAFFGLFAIARLITLGYNSNYVAPWLQSLPVSVTSVRPLAMLSAGVPVRSSPSTTTARTFFSFCLFLLGDSDPHEGRDLGVCSSPCVPGGKDLVRPRCSRGLLGKGISAEHPLGRRLLEDSPCLGTRGKAHRVCRERRGTQGSDSKDRPSGPWDKKGDLTFASSQTLSDWSAESPGGALDTLTTITDPQTSPQEFNMPCLQRAGASLLTQLLVLLTCTHLWEIVL